ncbi:uncharacterized protein [Anoplolepis gracilipes]|uniref:uncharacterized protein n=1 Tax=Anoplolepis gracilipes TaxID=354296 RepID=UPI003BA00BFE
MLYGAPVWAEDISDNQRTLGILHGVQRKMALRVVRAYHTVSFEAATSLAGIPPVELLARMYTDVYRRMRGLREAGRNIVCRARSAVGRQHHKKMLERWKQQLLSPSGRAAGRRVVEAIGPHLEA